MPHSTRLLLLVLALLVVPVAGCASSASHTADAERAVEEVRRLHAPDARTARFDVTVTERDGTVVLTGETTVPAARAALRDTLTARGLAVEDRITELPDTALGERTWAVVTNSVANLRSAPRHSAELSTQALLGTPLNVWKRSGGFYLVQTPDAYLGWVDAGGIERVDARALDRYRAAEKIVYLEPAGWAYEAPAPEAASVGDLVAGSLLETTGRRGDHYAVRYPDGRTAYVRAEEALPFDTWTDGLAPSETSLVATARRLQGLPYLWGGTSTKGVDCSGFTKTVYLLNGLILPRDASQQVHRGLVVDSTGRFDRLRPGDLLFFGRPATDSTRERVVHVGLWIGDDRFIHSAGRVHVSSFDSTDAHFDAYNRDRYLRTRRLLGTDAVPLVRDDGLFVHLRDGR